MPNILTGFNPNPYSNPNHYFETIFKIHKNSDLPITSCEKMQAGVGSLDLESQLTGNPLIEMFHVNGFVIGKVNLSKYPQAQTVRLQAQ